MERPSLLAVVKTSAVITGAIAATCTLLELYARTPSISKTKAKQHVDASGLGSISSSNSEELVIIFHGLGGAARKWPRRLALAIKSKSPSISVHCYDWEKLAVNMLKAAANAEILGGAVGHQLASQEGKSNSVQRIHLIAHSVGAFAADAAAREYRAAGGSASIELTFLAPFCMRGVFNKHFGSRMFGTGIPRTTVTQIYNTDDGVLSSNLPLHRAGTRHDITALPERAQWKPDIMDDDCPQTGRKRFHWWPVDYYILQCSDSSKFESVAEAAHEHSRTGSTAKPGPIQLFVERTIKDAFTPEYLEVTNESHRHHSDESHFHVLIVSSIFEGVRAVERSRAVTDLFKDETGCLKFHSLRLTAKTPAQWAISNTVPAAPKCIGSGDGRKPTDGMKFL